MFISGVVHVFTGQAIVVLFPDETHLSKSYRSFLKLTSFPCPLHVILFGETGTEKGLIRVIL